MGALAPEQTLAGVWYYPSVTQAEDERLHHGLNKEYVRQLSAGLQRQLLDTP
jgi:hypothetical protein